MAGRGQTLLFPLCLLIAILVGDCWIANRPTALLPNMMQNRKKTSDLEAASPSFRVLSRFPRTRTKAFASKERGINDGRSVGLLSGVKNVESSLYYSRKLDLEAASKLIRDGEYIYTCALKDIDGDELKLDKYLSDIDENSYSFFNSKKVWNRDALKGTLKNIIENKKGDTFACHLGGKSTGKSLVLHDLEKAYMDNMFVVNLRENPNILKGLINVLYKRNDPKYEELIMKFDAAAAAAATFGIQTSLSGALKSLDDAKKEGLTLQGLIFELLERIPGVVTIVIDAANIAFTIPAKADQKRIDETNEALALFTTLTKESRRLNVILVSSEHDLPFRLSDDLNFNLDNMDKFIFAGEVPPKDMLTLLTTQWGVGENLAMALISCYGGHIYDIDKAIVRLKETKSKFIPLRPDMTQNVLECLICKDIDEKTMVDTLKQLAIDGFVPLVNRNDPVAKIISKYNVGGVVQAISEPIGVPDDVWQNKKYKYGLVPSKQSMRLAIAEFLQDWQT